MSSIQSQQSLDFYTIMDVASLASTEIAMFLLAAFVYVSFTYRPIAYLKKPAKAAKRGPAPASGEKSRIPAGQLRAAAAAAPWQKRTPTTSKPKCNAAEQHSSSDTAGTFADLAKTASAIKSHAREGDLEAGVALLRKSVEDGSPPNALLYNCVLDACVQCGDLERALSFFEEIKSVGLVDVVSYNTVLKAYLRQSKITEAQGLLREMSREGVKASAVTYHELLNAMVVAQDRRGMWLLIDEMTKAGVPPSSITCSILLKAVADSSEPGDVQRTMGLLMSLEGPLDEVLLSSAIEACIRVKRLGLLSELMRRYRSLPGGLGSLSAPSFGSMIKAFGQAGDTAQVHALWVEMEHHNIKPTPITLGCMVEALVVNGQAAEAWDLVQRQQEEGTLVHEEGLLLNTVVYSSVLKGFATTKSIDMVFTVYDEMRKLGVECNAITYNTLLDACAKCDAMCRASAVLEDMRKVNVMPDIITYSTLIKGYCLEGSIEKAFRVLEDMQAGGKLEADEIMYNSLLDGCAKQQRVEEALKLLKEMEASDKVKPSNYTLSILVKLLGRTRRLGQAFEVVEDISSRHGFRPNVQVYTCLMQACMFNRRLDRALALHDTMVKARCAPDERLYVALVRGCMQAHAPRKAVDVIRAAFQLRGGALAVPGGRVAGIDKGILEEVFKTLQVGTSDDKAASLSLKADLESRGVSVGTSGGGGSAAPWRRGGADRQR